MQQLFRYVVIGGIFSVLTVSYCIYSDLRQIKPLKKLADRSEERRTTDDATKTSVFTSQTEFPVTSEAYTRDPQTSVTAIKTVDTVTTRSTTIVQNKTVSSTSRRSQNVFYNRIGKCGSRSLFRVAEALSYTNRFSVRSSTDYANESPPPRYARQEMVKIATMRPPTLYNRHIHYLDFKKYGFKQPIYINMIRDPTERFASHYNYLKYGDETGKVAKPRSEWENLTDCVMKGLPQCSDSQMTFYIGSYFCGLDEVCKNKSQASVRLAEKHIDEEYLVIGLLEEFDNTLHLLEKALPEYFRGARYVWGKNKDAWKRGTKTKRHDFLSEEAEMRLKEGALWHEYEVYAHAKAKFERLKQEYGIS